MKTTILVVWLGNPGAQYHLTRHNAWWLALDMLSEILWLTHFLEVKKYASTIAQWTYKDIAVMAVKPQTFMNKSGDAVGPIVNFYKIPQRQIIVLHDDVDLPFGAFKLKWAGSDGGHNGIKSITQSLGTDQYRRYKIGVGRSLNPNIETADHVLWQFSPEELTQLKNAKHTLETKWKEFVRNAAL
jgi:PTH1 family peptidyl-tRNA hydrolase